MDMVGITNIEQLENLSPQRLLEQGTVDGVIKLEQQLINESEYYQARTLVRVLGKKLNSLGAASIDATHPYWEVLGKLGILSLNFGTEEEAVQIFENGLGYALADEDIDIQQRLRAMLLEIFVLEKDNVRDRLRAALERNNNQLSSTDLVVDDKKIPGTIANWLKDYVQEKGAEIQNKLDIADYFTSGKNTKNLSQGDKVKLRQLLDIYEFLKLSSLTEFGLETPLIYIDIDGKLKILDDRQVTSFEGLVGGEKAPLSEERKNRMSNKSFLPSEVETLIQSDPTELKQEVLAAYKGDPQQQKAIAKEIKNLDKKFGSSIEVLHDEFFSSVQQKNVYRTIGALMLLTQKDDLLNFIATDQKLNKFLAAIWEKQYGLELVNDFKINPTNVKYIKLFLQYVLEQRLGLNENDAARVGLQIGNAFAGIGKTSYNKMAYFDIQTKEFKWFEESQIT